MKWIESALALVFLLLLIYFPQFFWVMIAYAAAIGIRGYVRFCRQNPSIWQMRRRAAKEAQHRAGTVE